MTVLEDDLVPTGQSNAGRGCSPLWLWKAGGSVGAGGVWESTYDMNIVTNQCVLMGAIQKQEG